MLPGHTPVCSQIVRDILPGMAKFTVTTNEGKVAAYEGKYRLDGGVLTVLPEVGNEVLFSPAGWLLLEIKEADPPVT